MSNNPFRTGDWRIAAAALTGLAVVLAVTAAAFWNRSLFITDSWT